MKKVAHQTLDHPMTFETIGESLRLFQGSALRDLVHFRRRCSDNILTCFNSFLKVRVDAPGPSSIWDGCRSFCLPSSLSSALSCRELHERVFTHPLPTPSNVRALYLTTIQHHYHCSFCLRVHAEKGSNFAEQLEVSLTHALEKVHTSFL